MNRQLGINVFGFIKGEFGIAEATRLNCKAILQADIPLNIINYDVKTNHNDNDNTFTEFAEKADHPINLIQISPSEEVFNFFSHFDFSFFENKYNILYMAWESETIPEPYIAHLNLFDEIWTPSEYCKNCIEKYVSLPVIVIPHPVQFPVNEPEDKTVKDIFDKNKFNFLFIFDYNSSLERKNVLSLIKVFRKTFDTGENNAFLTIKTSLSTRFPEEKKQILDAIGSSERIKIVEKIFDKNSLNNLISHCDCYISLHRAEGFGLTMAEAMFLGKPVIATGYSGNLEFMNPENSFLVQAQKISSQSAVINYDSNTVWSEPDLQQTEEYLRIVFNDRELLENKAQKGYASVHEKLSFQHIGQLIKERGLEIIAQNKIEKNKSQLIKIYSEYVRLKKDLKIYKKSAPIQLIYNVKMYLRNRKGRK